MTSSVTGNRGIHLGCVAAAAIALTVGVVQPGSELVRVESHQVLLGSAVVSAVENSSAAPATAATTSPASDSPAAATVAAATDDPAAIPRTVAQIVLTAGAIALAPLWYLGFPITLPWTAVLFWNAGSNLGAAGWGNLATLTLTPLAWLSFPLIAGSALALVLFPPPTATVTPPVATARSAARRASGMAPTSPAASRGVGSLQASRNPMAAKSKRSIAHATASRSSAKAKAVSVASETNAERSPVGKADRKRKSE